MTIYRLPAGQLGSAEYEQFTVFVINSQVFHLIRYRLSYAFGRSNHHHRRHCLSRHLEIHIMKLTNWSVVFKF